MPNLAEHLQNPCAAMVSAIFMCNSQRQKQVNNHPKMLELFAFL
jgi:hypothetical protein